MRRARHFFEDFFQYLFDVLPLLFGGVVGFLLGYFGECFGQIALAVTVELGLEAVFAEVLYDVIFAKLKV